MIVLGVDVMDKIRKRDERELQVEELVKTIGLEYSKVVWTYIEDGWWGITKKCKEQKQRCQEGDVD